MTAHTSDALASALPAGIVFDFPQGDQWGAHEIAEFQAEELAEAGYVLVHTAPDEATVERLGEVLASAHLEFYGDREIPHWGRHLAEAILAALADTSAQALGPDPAQARMDSIAADRAQARHTAGDAMGDA